MNKKELVEKIAAEQNVTKARAEEMVNLMSALYEQQIEIIARDRQDIIDIVEKLCGRIAIIKKGDIKVTKTIKEIEEIMELSYVDGNWVNDNFETFGEAVITCAEAIGKVISVDYIEDQNAVEIWVRTEQNENLCMYLFNCESMFVSFGG